MICYAEHSTVLQLNDVVNGCARLIRNRGSKTAAYFHMVHEGMFFPQDIWLLFRRKFDCLYNETSTDITTLLLLMQHIVTRLTQVHV